MPTILADAQATCDLIYNFPSKQPGGRSLNMAATPMSTADRTWLVLIALLVVAYIGYALRGGFFFDDFFLYNRYAGDHAAWWRYHEHFGRIVTRYLYWACLPGILGNRPELYFLFNLVFVLFGAWAFGRLMVAMAESERVMLPTVAIYLLAPTTIHSFTWIAAFQHLGAYPFLFVFLWKMVELARSWGRLTMFVAMASFAVAMISNQFAVIAPAAALVLTLPWAFRNPRYLIVVVVLGGVSLAVVLALMSDASRQAYVQVYSWAQVATNLAWYGDRLGFGSSLPKYLALLALVLIVATRSYRSVLFAGVAVIGALPFIFLALRRNAYFIHLAYVFLTAALMFAANRVERPWPRGTALALLVALVGYSSFHMHKETYLEPLGGALKKEMAMIRAGLPGNGNTVCVAYDSDDTQQRRRHHHMTVALSAYQILDPRNAYVRYDRVESCEAARFRLLITFDESGTLRHTLVDTATGSSLSTSQMQHG